MAIKLNPPINSIPITQYVGFDLETTGLDPIHDKITLIILYTDGVYVIEPNKYTRSDIIQLLKKISKVCVVGHNLKFDLGFVYFHYKLLFYDVWDTELVSRVLHNGLDGYKHGLYNVIETFLGVVLDVSEKQTTRLTFQGYDLTEKQLQYAANDVKYLITLQRKQQQIVDRDKLSDIVKLENTLVPTITKMEVDGCRIDVDGWKQTIKFWEQKLNEIVQELDAELINLNKDKNVLPHTWLRTRPKIQSVQLDLFGEPLVTEAVPETHCNYASQQQVVQVFKLFDVPLPTVKVDGEMKVSVDEGSLNQYLAEYPNTPLRNFITKLLQYREYAKLLSTYGESFLAKIDKNNYIHTRYRQCKTATGRLSSSEPNLQNIPATSLTEDGYDLRRLFLADPGHVMVTCDMDMAEVRIAADYSQDPILLGAVLNNEDMHSRLASTTFSIIFGQPVVVNKSDELIHVGQYSFKKSELRNAHKAVVFAKFYKAGPQRCYSILAYYINLFHKDNQNEIAKQISNALDEQLVVLSNYLDGVIKEAQQKRSLRGSKLGRIRYFEPNVYGEAANYPIQNTNAEAMKIALIQLDRYFRTNNYGRIVMTIHDEVVCSVKQEHAEEVAAKVKEVMSNSLGWFFKHVKGGASVKIAPHWIK